MERMNWRADERTAYWARKIGNLVVPPFQPQYDGGNRAFLQHTWHQNILASQFPSHCQHPSRPDYLRSSPANIIQCFQEKNVLEGLALTVAWGAMTRQKPKIYNRSLAQIQEILFACLDDINTTGCAEGAWSLLTGTLGWSDVMASKSLHFMVRSLGCETNPPVPIDNKVVLNEVWPQFYRRASDAWQPGVPDLPGPWREGGYAWAGYNRYMTAISCWAEAADCTYTQLESTLFHQFYP